MHQGKALKKQQPYSQTAEYRREASRKRRSKPGLLARDAAQNRAAFNKRKQKYLAEQESSFGLSSEAKAFIIRRMYNNARSRAKRLGIPFEITKDDIVLPEVCPVSNERMVLGTRSRTDRANFSLDRIDNSKGYIKGNVAVISLRANVVKGSFDVAYFERLIAYMKGIPNGQV